jgi:hypothetical protein
VSLSSSALPPCCSVCHPRRFATTVAQAEKLLGVTARELFEMRSTDNQAGYDKVFADCLFKPIIAKVRTAPQSRRECRVQPATRCEALQRLLYAAYPTVVLAL